MKPFIFTILVLFINTCNGLKKKTDEPVIARVFDKTLTSTELTSVIPDNLNTSDSIVVAQSYVNKWVRKQLLLHKAELNLTENEMNVKRQIEEYKASLLIFKYEQNYLSETLDTIVSDEEIEAYYNDNSSNFILDNNLVKGQFIAIPRSAHQISMFQRWFRRNTDEAKIKMERYCAENAAVFTDFNEGWTEFETITNQWPDKILNEQSFIRYRQRAETKDTLNYYFLRIDEYQLKGNLAPLHYVQEDIKSIIINKRKIQLIKELEADVYNDALNHNSFIIY